MTNPRHSREGGNPIENSNPVTDHLDIWSSVYVKKATAGRGSNGKNSPYGIQKLRELILELTVRGKLVPQDPSDEPANVLLEKIAEKKVQLIKKRKIKKQKPLPEITDKDEPFELPKGWAWARFGTVFELEYGKNLPQGKRSNSGEYAVYGSNGIVGTHNSYCIDKPCVVIGRKGSAGALNLCLDEKCWVTDVAYSTMPPSDMDLDFTFKLFHTLGLGSLGKGIKPGLNRNEAYILVVTIPPLAEQHRIVTKVDELMAFCDQLEHQQTDSLQAHQTLVETLLRTLVNASDAQSAQQAWNRIAEHFDTLFTTEESIDQLKQTILQLAVMGKLVPQDSNDEPASVLLEMIAEEKERLVKEKKIRRAKPVPELSFEERFSYLSKKWEEVRFAEFVIEVATGPFGSMVHKSDYINGGVQLINPSHMIDGKIIPDSSISVSDEKAVELESHKLLVGDVVMARRGEMGRCAVVTNESIGFLCGTGSFVLRFHKDIDRSYVLLLFRSEYVRSYLGGESVGATMTNLNHGILNKMPIAVPPVKEQSRIVAKVDELMGLCDALKARIQDTQTTQSNLADAVVEQAVA